MQHTDRSSRRGRTGRSVRFAGAGRSRALAFAAFAGAALAQQGAGAAPPGAAVASAGVAARSPLHGEYERLRAQLNWVPVKVGGRDMLTPDPKSRLLLARSAADRAGLAEVGLDFRDVYGVIAAETSWVPRKGMGRNGVTSEGLAQFEPATARSLGVQDVNDAVEAVHAAARLLKEAAQWSARRIASLGLDRAERAARLREGVSIYYNLSSAGRERWNGISDATLPVETRRHIRNVRAGIEQAQRLHAGAADTGLPTIVAAAQPAPAAERLPARRAAAAKPAVPMQLGTIEWSGAGSDADGRRSGRHVVWSDGSVTREGGRVRWTSAVPRNG